MMSTADPYKKKAISLLPAYQLLRVEVISICNFRYKTNDEIETYLSSVSRDRIFMVYIYLSMLCCVWEKRRHVTDLMDRYFTIRYA
jgi:hypothetical protein